jgi:cysteine desulfurase
MTTPPIIYLDHAAATPVDPEVFRKMEPFFQRYFFNPSATYTAAITVRKALEEARAQVAFWLGVQLSEIIFTAGGTEANNLAIQGILTEYPTGNIVISSIEHESVLAASERFDVRLAPVLPGGQVDVAALHNLIDSNTILVSIMYANNEIGTVQPLREIAQIISEQKAHRRAKNVSQSRTTLPLYFHSDACQAANYLDLHVARLGVDLLTLNGGKMYGPKQSGILYIKRGIQLRPSIVGGGQESGLRSGTENVAGAIGLASALETAQQMRKGESLRLQKLQQLFIRKLSEVLPLATINGSLEHRLPNNIHITFPGYDNERLLIQLDELGIQAAAGSACSASNDEPSHVLRAIGLSDTDTRSSIRCTMGRATTEAMVERAVMALTELVQ